MDFDRRRLNKISQTIIGCSYTVSNSLGSGFLEKVYENAMAHEIRKANLSVDQQRNINVYYDNIIVGTYIADLMIEDSVIIELKAVKALEDIHMAQCMNYLNATKLRLCLLINFGNPKVEIKRIVNKF